MLLSSRYDHRGQRYCIVSPTVLYPIGMEKAVTVIRPPNYRGSFKITLKNFPLMPADAMTVHKSQGTTITTPVFLPSYHSFSISHIYVSLIRVKSFQQVFTGEDINVEKIKKWKWKKDLVDFLNEFNK